MNRYWLMIVVAAFFEVMWVIRLKYADQIWSWIVTIIAIILIFYLLIASGKKLPVGSAYAVFVGLGTAGTVITEILFFNEPVDYSKLILIAILLAGVIELKMVTEEKEHEGGEA